VELRQLEYFVAVAEEADFTRAAERVHISQSGVSAQVDQACAAIGLRPGASLQATAPAAVADLAARGLGVAVLSASVAADFTDLTAVPIDEITIPALLALVWRKQNTLVTAFTRALA
jgi:DNA-binding transcriptional LysR family regulator